MAVAGSGAICGGSEDVGGVSSAREPRTVDMTAVASMGSVGAMEDVASARVATSDMGVDWGGGGVEVVGGVEVGAEAVVEAAAVAAADSSTNICASTICCRWACRLGLAASNVGLRLSFLAASSIALMKAGV